MASIQIGKQAVVIGAGMAGLTAAGALADSFDNVVVLERDSLPSEPMHRAGTPQARHVHGLLFSGQRALNELFPGFEQDLLLRAGAVPLTAGLDVRVERPGYDPFPQRDLGWCGYAASRPAIERAVRHRVESRANITLRQRCRVREVLPAPNGEAVTGVRYENGGGESETISADLVVDASGRGAPTLGLLQSLGRPLPEETTIGIDLGYGTCIFSIPDDASTDWKGVMTFGQAPHNSRGGLMLPLEGNRWMVTIGGRHGDVPPGDGEGFLTYAKALRTPTIYNAIRHAKRLDGVARYGFPEGKFGVLPASNGVSRLTRIVGTHWARYLIMANLSVDADRALIMGLVHEVWPDETFETEVMRFCRHLAAQHGEQMGAAKIAIELARDVGLAQARNVERMANSALMLNPDYRAGIEKYVQGIGSKYRSG